MEFRQSTSARSSNNEPDSSNERLPSSIKSSTNCYIPTTKTDSLAQAQAQAQAKGIASTKANNGSPGSKRHQGPPPAYSNPQAEIAIDQSSSGDRNNPEQSQPQPQYQHHPQQAQTSTAAVNTNENIRPRRNVSSLGSSLRRLLTITFSRNSRSSSSSSTTIGDNIHGSAGNSSSSGAGSNRKAKGKTGKVRRHEKSVHKDNTGSGVGAAAAAAASGSDNRPKRQLTFEYSRDSNASASIKNENASEISETNRRRSSTLQPLNDSNSLGGKRKTSSDFDSKNTSSKGVASTSRASVTSSISWAPPLSIEIAKIDGSNYLECPICVLLFEEKSTPTVADCKHRVCLDCMDRYLTTEINHSRLNIKCPMCPELINPNTIKFFLRDDNSYQKYESFMLRRVLAAEPDARWCPAPDCGFAVLANGCASCPKLLCGREGCNTSFCYHCKQEWHPNQTCSAASMQRNKRTINVYTIGDLIEESTVAASPTARKSNKSSSQSSQSQQRAGSVQVDDIRECPVCASRIIKMNDGSCNHMTCSICETEFCWLCMREITDLHYFSPSGCTFWGKKPWSRKKKLLWQLGMLVGAPICIILIAGIAVPAIVIGIPVWAARKLHARLESKPLKRYKKNAIITTGVLLSFVVSPIISAVALAVGIPILLTYVYGVVPLSLCRSSGACLSPAPSLEAMGFIPDRKFNRSYPARDGISIDTAMSHKLGDASIGETSLYMSNISLETNSIGHVTAVEREDRESASNAALAGSIISNSADDGNSTRALAGSIISKGSGYTLISAEVHNNSSNLSQTTTTQTPSATNLPTVVATNELPTKTIQVQGK